MKTISYKQLRSQHMQSPPHAASHASPSTAGRSATLDLSLPKLLHTPSHMEKLLYYRILPDPDLTVQPYSESIF